MTSWHSYPSIFNVGHGAIKDIFLEPVVVEEKIDGSQFSFGLIAGELRCRSKSAQLNLDAPEKMFNKVVDFVKSIQHLLTPEWTYRGEYLQKPKHNTLAYGRVPNNHFILFDINTAQEVYLSYSEKYTEATRIGVECVPLLVPEGWTEYNAELFHKLMETTSILGGQKIEGVVIKNYTRFGKDHKALMAKHVSESFKEVHKLDWKDRNPGGEDFIQQLGQQYRTPARWQKAVQHLKEAGTLEGSPRDIGNLMKETSQDILKECETEIKEALFKYAWPKIGRAVVRGLPEWYKNELLEGQFKNNEVKV